MNNTDLKLNDVLAIDRTRLAAERNLMAWVRTALSMITFGFTIYKVLQALQEHSTVPVLRPHAPRKVGLTLLGIGTFALAVACVQHGKHLRRLTPDQPHKPWDLAFIVAILIGLLGLLLFGSIFHGRPIRLTCL